MRTSGNLFMFLASFLVAFAESSDDNKTKLTERHPEVKKEVNLSSTNSSITIYVSSNDRDIDKDTRERDDWKFSLILSCTDYLEIHDNENDILRNSSCHSTGGSHDHDESHNHHLRHIPGHHVMPTNTLLIDGLTDVTIRLIGNNDDTRTYNFSIIASLYYETTKTYCDKGYFDCSTKTLTCPNSGPNAYRYVEITNPEKHRINPRRCIPNVNRCNNVPSCGYEFNVDEADPVCHLQEYCQLIFDWMFIATRSLVAIIFVVIPALVVYLLFQRRQVALHRARLLQERARMESHRHGSLAIITMQNKYENDLPPTYDDLYDTKDPPPCFCAVQQQQASASPVDNFASSSTNSHVNPGFECTCNNNRSNTNSSS